MVVAPVILILGVRRTQRMKLQYRQCSLLKLVSFFIFPIADSFFIVFRYLKFKVLLLEDQMSERSYLAEMAGLSLECRMDDNAGFTLRVFGFADKAPRLLLEALTCLGNLHHGQATTTTTPSDGASKNSLLSAQRFSALKEQLARRYRNGNLKPAKHASRLRLALLLPNTFSPTEKLEALMGSSFNQQQGAGEGDDNIRKYPCRKMFFFPLPSSSPPFPFSDTPFVQISSSSSSSSSSPFLRSGNCHCSRQQ
jgi:hypothetical protein